MHPGIILETNDPERVWNAFRLATTTLEAGHVVETFLLGDGVEAPDLDHERFNPHGVLRNHEREGGDLLACGTCLDSREVEADDLRPRSTTGDCLRVVEDADEVLTIGRATGAVDVVRGRPTPDRGHGESPGWTTPRPKSRGRGYST